MTKDVANSGTNSSKTDPPVHPAALPILQLLKDCRETRTRRGGPGGQHRNKVETAVVLEHLPTGISAEANERRSQAENREVAVQRLRVRLAVQIREAISPNASPSELWRSRVRSKKIAVNERHEDYPAILAEAIDTVSHFEFQMPAAAALLGISASQLTKLLQTAPEAIGWVNAQRKEAGLRELR